MLSPPSKFGSGNDEPSLAWRLCSHPFPTGWHRSSLRLFWLSQVMFSDEVMVEERDGHGKAWTTGNRVHQVVKGQPLRTVYWAAMGHRRSTSLVRVGRVDAASYVQTLQRHLLPLRKRDGANFNSTSFLGRFWDLVQKTSFFQKCRKNFFRVTSTKHDSPCEPEPPNVCSLVGLWGPP